jgi:hypothetical protein
MAELLLSYPAQILASKARLTESDIALLSRETFPGGVTSDQGVLTLLAIYNSCPNSGPVFDAYFQHLLADYTVNVAKPRGFVDQAKAAWFRRLFSFDGVIRTSNELELLLRVLETSPTLPSDLVCLALEQLRLAVSGNYCAYTTQRGKRGPGIIASDLDYLRRILRNRSADGEIALFDKERMLLKAIADTVAASRNEPAWEQCIEALLNDDGRTAATVLWNQRTVVETQVPVAIAA